VNPAVAELVHEACMSGTSKRQPDATICYLFNLNSHSGAASPDSSNTLRCTDNSSSSSGPAGGGGGVVSDGNGATGTTGSGDAAGATPPSVAVNGTIPNGTIGANGTVETILPPGQSHPASSAGVPATSASNISTSENSAPNNPAVASALASRHHTATIAAIVCGVIAVLAILLALFLWDRRRRHARKDLLKVHSFYSEFFPIQNPPMSAVSKVTDGLTPLTPSNELSAAHNLAGEPDLDISASPISNPTDVSLALAQANAQANTRSLSHTFANEKSGAFPPSTSFSSTPLSHSPGPSESLASSLTDGQLLSENAALRAQIETLRAMVRPNDSTATSSDAQSPVESHISLAQSLSSPLTANPQLRTEMAALLNEIERLRLALPPTELAPPPYISAAN
jgi:hypothetical protein